MPELGFIEGVRQTSGQESHSDAPQGQGSQVALDITEVSESPHCIQ